MRSAAGPSIWHGQSVRMTVCSPLRFGTGPRRGGSSMRHHDANRPRLSSRRWLLFLLILLAMPAFAQPPEQLPPPTPGPNEPAPAGADGIPPWLPRYDLTVRIDVAKHHVQVRQRVVWTNHHARPATELVLNAHAHYKVPFKDIPLVAKTLEILRMTPSDSLDFGPAPLEVEKVTLADQPTELPSSYQPENDTALVVQLPAPVEQGQSVAVELTYNLHLPQKQGRWGQWRGVTFLSNWIPVLSVYDDNGWHPTPFVPWHQP